MPDHSRFPFDYDNEAEALGVIRVAATDPVSNQTWEGGELPALV